MLAGGLFRLDLAADRVVAVGGVTQKNAVEHRHAVFARRQVGIGAQLIGGLPKVGFDLVNALERACRHFFLGTV